MNLVKVATNNYIIKSSDYLSIIINTSLNGIGDLTGLFHNLILEVGGVIGL